MASIAKLIQKYRNSPIHLQLIYLNIVIFLTIAVINVTCKLLLINAGAYLNLLCFPADFELWLHAPWSVITYMFVHTEPLHLLFNILCLYWFGNIFLTYYSSIHLRGLYIIGGISGAVLYMLFYNIFPYFTAHISHSFLIGASASITALIVACAIKAPDYIVQPYFLIRIRLKFLAIIILIIDGLMVVSDNAGGHIAHLGGAIAGLLFVYYLSRGTDITKWINIFISFCAKLFNSKTYKRKPRLKVYKSDKESDYDFNAKKKHQQEVIDHILDKIKTNGYNNLSEEEKRTLFDASRKQ